MESGRISRQLQADVFEALSIWSNRSLGLPQTQLQPGISRAWRGRFEYLRESHLERAVEASSACNST